MGHLRPNKIALAALAIVIAMATGGCGSSSDETTGASETTAPPASTTPGQEAPVGVRATSCDATGSSGEVRVTGVSCEVGRSLVAGWHKNTDCSAPEGASRTPCKVGGFFCLGAVTNRGVAVTCAAPGRSVAFIGRKPG
jgi:hypothetical protein